MSLADLVLLTQALHRGRLTGLPGCSVGRACRLLLHLLLFLLLVLLLLSFVQRVHHQLHDGRVYTQSTHQVRVLEEHFVVHQVPGGVRQRKNLDYLFYI